MQEAKSYSAHLNRFRHSPKKWLITGVAGFIGSNLLETLLRLEQEVVGLDNFQTGYMANLESVRSAVTPLQWSRFRLLEGDICKLETCHQALKHVDYVLHHAALGSVPRSIEDPIASNAANVTGFLNMLVASKDAFVKRFVYAASSSTYGDHPGLPKKEDIIGKPLSPYAITKYVNELYAEIFRTSYGLQSVGLRYFNVFGPRQDPKGAYASVIPRWIEQILKGEQSTIYGDGDTSRDFCYIDNVIQANLLSATKEDLPALNQVYNVAVGQRTTLNQLFSMIKEGLLKRVPSLKNQEPIHQDFRVGDVRHSQADIEKAKSILGYEPQYFVDEGVSKTLDWFVNRSS